MYVYIQSLLTVCEQDQDRTGLVLLLVGCQLVGLMGSDVWNVSWISRYMGLCSPVHCSEISCLCGDMFGYTVVHMVIIVKFCWYVLVKLWCYWCDHIRICCFACAVHKVIGVRCVLYIMCSWYLCLRLQPVCSIYDIWHVLQVSL